MHDMPPRKIASQTAVKKYQYSAMVRRADAGTRASAIDSGQNMQAVKAGQNRGSGDEEHRSGRRAPSAMVIQRHLRHTAETRWPASKAVKIQPCRSSSRVSRAK